MWVGSIRRLGRVRRITNSVGDNQSYILNDMFVLISSNFFCVKVKFALHIAISMHEVARLNLPYLTNY